MQSKRNKIVLAVICCIIAVFAIVFITQAVNKKSDASQADTTAKTYNDLLYMTFDRTDTENYSAELLPYDCEYVLINGEKFDAVKGSILVDGKAVEFNLLVEANKRSENTKMIAVDKSGNKHEVNQ